MLVSLSKKFIFIHIYKVAGSSLRQALSKYSYHPNDNFINKLFNTTLSTVAQKDTAVYFDINGLYPLIKLTHGGVYDIEKINQKVFDDFYTFAFVRNPWDWQVSLYHYVLQRPNHKNHKVIKQIGGFKEYVKWKRCQPKIRCQTDFLLNKDGQLKVDYVGRLETIEEDFKFLSSKLKLNTTLSHQNQSNHQKYCDYYDDESKQLTQQIFQRDIDLLGYSFDSHKNQLVHKLIHEKLK